jgi:hypothetical protein
VKILLLLCNSKHIPKLLTHSLKTANIKIHNNGLSEVAFSNGNEKTSKHKEGKSNFLHLHYCNFEIDDLFYKRSLLFSYPIYSRKRFQFLKILPYYAVLCTTEIEREKLNKGNAAGGCSSDNYLPSRFFLK